MSTPEGKVKERVKRILAKHKPQLYAHWPVQAGFGAPTLDCNGAILGHPFTIETKAPKKKPTPRQILTMQEMKVAGYKVFLIDGEKYPYTLLEKWLAQQYKHR
jgi:hypothetical protein